MKSPFCGMCLLGLCFTLLRHFWQFSYSNWFITWLRTLDLEFCGCVSAAVTRGRRCPWPRTGFRVTWSGGHRRSSTSPSTTSRTGTRSVWTFFASHAFLQLVFQPLISAQTGFSVQAYLPSGLDYWSLNYMLPIQHTEDLSKKRAGPAWSNNVKWIDALSTQVWKSKGFVPLTRG